MSRLPTSLQPLWPVVKRGHRLAARGIGATTRTSASVFHSKLTLPRRATERVEDTVALEPDSVRLHLGGPAETLRRPIPIGHPPDHWMFHWRASYDVPRRFVMEMEDGTVLGEYAAHVTSGGTLDYETSRYFGIAGWREHPLFISHRMPKRQQVEGTVLSLSVAGSSANYYHFLMDVLPRWGVFRETLPHVHLDACYLNSQRRYQRQLMGMLGLDRLPAIEPGSRSAVQASTLMVPNLPNPDLMAPTWTTNWLKTHLPALDVKGLPRRIYLTRGNARNTRRLVEEDAHFRTLEKLGFVRIDPGTLTVQQQIDHFAAAEAVVAPHGAALTNLVFCNPGVRVLELFAPGYVNPCYWTIADNIPDVRYRYLVGKGRPRPKDRPMNGVLTDISIRPPDLRESLEDLLS